MRRRLVAATLGVAGLGTAVGQPAVVLLAAAPLFVLAAGALASPPHPDIAVSRSPSTTTPALGERVTVRVTVENRGPTMRECLIEDAPPSGLGVVGTPQRSVRLPAGESTTLEYAVVARRGHHEFGDVRVTSRGLTDETAVERSVETTLRYRPDGRPLSVRAPVSRRFGESAGDTGGSGVEFHSVREYLPSDPQRRIDWRRFARTRELTTVQFREEESRTVHLVVDAREACAVRANAVAPSALSYAADAAQRLATAFAARGVTVGVGLYPDSLTAVPPGTGRDNRERIEGLLATHAAFPWGREAETAPDATSGASARGDGGLPAALQGDARVVVVSPCLDDAPVSFVESLDAAGVDVGVLAPNVGSETPGAVVERALRGQRLARLDAAGVRAVDWNVETPLERAVEEVFATWV